MVIFINFNGLIVSPIQILKHNECYGKTMINLGYIQFVRNNVSKKYRIQYWLIFNFFYISLFIHEKLNYLFIILFSNAKVLIFCLWNNFFCIFVI